jgi:hypothetical protein
MASRPGFHRVSHRAWPRSRWCRRATTRIAPARPGARSTRGTRRSGSGPTTLVLAIPLDGALEPLGEADPRLPTEFPAMCAGLGRMRSSRACHGKRLSASGRSSCRPTRSPRATIMRRLDVRRVVSAIEGDGLFNDATALVAHCVAVAAVMAGSFSLAEAGWEFGLERPAARHQHRGRVDRRRDPLAHHRRPGQRSPSRSRGWRSESRLDRPDELGFPRRDTVSNEASKEVTLSALGTPVS